MALKTIRLLIEYIKTRHLINSIHRNLLFICLFIIFNIMFHLNNGSRENDNHYEITKYLVIR